MWLCVPGTIEKVLWEGEMEVAHLPGAHESTQRGEGDVQDLPIVSVGRPTVWRLEDLYTPNDMHHMLRRALERTDFYLVRLACSFRSCREEDRVTFARFAAQLLPEDDQLLAYDIYPLEVSEQIKRNVRITLNPTLKFREIEATAGEVGFGLEYMEIQPYIWGAGIGEKVATWEYAETKGVGIQGSKIMHLLVSAPLGMEKINAYLHIGARVDRRGAILALLGINDEKKARGCLTARLV